MKYQVPRASVCLRLAPDDHYVTNGTFLNPCDFHILDICNQQEIYERKCLKLYPINDELMRIYHFNF